jgi:hypothetical protein
MHIYAGFKDWNKISLSQIYVDEPSSFPSAIAELQKNAQDQHDQSARYILGSTYTYIEKEKEDPHFKHVEDINIDILLSLNLDTMKDGEIYWIGD